MSTSEIEIIKLALNAGTFGLNVLIIVLLYKLADRWALPLIRAITEFSAALADLAARIDKNPKPASPPREKDSR